MVARHIPTFMAIGVLLIAYRFLGIADLFKDLIKQEMLPTYDYIIGRSSINRSPLLMVAVVVTTTTATTTITAITR